MRHGPIGLLLRLIAWISLVFGPVALLVFFELQFLPYHDVRITMWQRIAVFIDLLLLWPLWPAILHGGTNSRVWRSIGWNTGLACTNLVSLVLVFGIATFPGEWLDQHLPSVRLPLVQTSLYELLVHGTVDAITLRPTSLWSNRLVLVGFDTASPAKSVPENPEAVLRGRHLEGAVLVNAVLAHVDFTGADLTDAVLDNADLSKTKMCSQAYKELGTLSSGPMGFSPSSSRNVVPRRVSPICAQLQRVSLEGAQMQGACLSGADLSGANLSKAIISDAELRGTDLSKARMIGTNLSDAVLSRANLNGAMLFSVNLSGADLSGVDLQHAGPLALNRACGSNAKLPAFVTLKPCQPKQVAPPPCQKTAP